MQRLALAVVALAVLSLIPLAAADAAPGAAAEDRGTPVPDHGRLIVGFEEPDPSIQEGDSLEGYPVVTAAPDGAFAAVQVGDDADAPGKFRGDPGVAYVEWDKRGQAAGFTPNDPYYDDQYAPQQIGLPQAWTSVRGGSEVPVCVADTGVRYTHQELEGSRWKGGYDYVNDDGDPWDDDGHGTLTTSVAAAGLDDGVGMAGSGNLNFYHMKILDSDGTGWYSDWAAGMRDCMDEGDVVISMSLGGVDPSTTLEDAAEDAWEDGDIVVAAAHNDGPCSDCIRYPAAYAEVIAVTCTDSSENLCDFSSTGPGAELAAPGAGIIAAYNKNDGDYAKAWGTSLSTPWVSGAAALLWTRTPDLSNAEVRQLLDDNAQDLGPDGRDNDFGYGEVEVGDALPPTKPQEFQVDPGGPDEVTLSWEPPADEGAGPVQEYRIFRGHPGDPLQLVDTIPGTGTVYFDEGPHHLQPQQYRYTVQAVNSAGGGPTPKPVCEGATPWGNVDGPSKRICEEGRHRRQPVSVHPFTDTAGDRNLVAASGTGDAEALVAASGTGDADTTGGVGVTATGDASGLAPVSATGDCSYDGEQDERCFAVETGSARGYHVAVGFEDATCTQGIACAAVAGFGTAQGTAAASALGPARGAVAASGTGPAEGLAAASGTGDATGVAAAASGTGHAQGIAAVSGTGTADGVFLEFSGCESFSLLCYDPPTPTARSDADAGSLASLP